MVQALRLPLSCPFVLIASCPGFYRHARSHYGLVFSWWRTKQLAVIAAELGRAFIAHLVANTGDFLMPQQQAAGFLQAHLLLKLHGRYLGDGFEVPVKGRRTHT